MAECVVVGTGSDDLIRAMAREPGRRFVSDYDETGDTFEVRRPARLRSPVLDVGRYFAGKLSA